MPERLQRSRPADLEVRGDGRTVTGICVPFDAPTEVTDLARTYTETFRRGAFVRTLAERGARRVKFLANHDSKAWPIGRADVLREDAAGLYGEFRVPNTQAGDDVLELIREGVLDGLSIGFRPMRDQWTRDRSAVDRLEVRLDEVSLVAYPAYDLGRVSGIRSEDADRRLTPAEAFDRLLAWPHR